MPHNDAVKKAVALRYHDGQDKVPRVVASGKGEIAAKIVATATAAGVPIHQDAGLAEMLARLDIGVNIPAELYQVVAAVLAYIYVLDMRQTRN